MVASPATEVLRQATTIAIGGRAILIEGPPGCGKSSLALGLIDRGAVLVGDDGVALTVDNGTLIAHPPSATTGLIEMRNIGIVQLPCSPAPVALHLTIADTASRYVDQASIMEIEGVAIPSLAFALGTGADCMRVEYALAVHGLKSSALPFPCAPSGSTAPL